MRSGSSRGDRLIGLIESLQVGEVLGKASISSASAASRSRRGPGSPRHARTLARRGLLRTPTGQLILTPSWPARLRTCGLSTSATTSGAGATARVLPGGVGMTRSNRAAPARAEGSCRWRCPPGLEPDRVGAAARVRPDERARDPKMSLIHFRSPSPSASMRGPSMPWTRGYKRTTSPVQGGTSSACGDAGCSVPCPGVRCAGRTCRCVCAAPLRVWRAEYFRPPGRCWGPTLT